MERITRASASLFSQFVVVSRDSSDRLEPPHVHVLRDDNVAKIWLSTLAVEYNYGYNERDLNRIVRLARANQERLVEAWNEYFSR